MRRHQVLKWMVTSITWIKSALNFLINQLLEMKMKEPDILDQVWDIMSLEYIDQGCPTGDMLVTHGCQSFCAAHKSISLFPNVFRLSSFKNRQLVLSKKLHENCLLNIPSNVWIDLTWDLANNLKSTILISLHDCTQIMIQSSKHRGTDFQYVNLERLIYLNVFELHGSNSMILVFIYLLYFRILSLQDGHSYPSVHWKKCIFIGLMYSEDPERFEVGQPYYRLYVVKHLLHTFAL
jgi:hypothetical protein